MPERKTPLKPLVVLTLIFSLGAVLCWAWAELKASRAGNEIAEAARRGDIDAMLQVPASAALNWFITSFILLFIAIVIGAITLLYWTIARKERMRSERQSL
jgi:hypothetical protein